MHAHSTFHRLVPLFFLAFLATISLQSAALADCTNLWITTGGCGPASAGSLVFHPGDVLYFNGVDFTQGPNEWTIYGRPGSCDEYTTIVRSSVNVDASGTFCFEAYTIASDDCGEYAVQIGECYTVYTVEQNCTLQVMDISLAGNWEEATSWSIHKTVQPEVLNLFTGDQADVHYTVTVDKSVVTSPAVISGTVSLQSSTPNPAGFSLTLTLRHNGSSIDQTTLTTWVASGQFPFSFTLATPEAGSYSLEAVAAVTNCTGDSQTESVTLSKTLTGYPLIHVVDGAHSWQYSDDGSASYSTVLSCDADEGVKSNTATITETSQSASANVTINCYAPEVTKTADPRFTRTYHWSLLKSGDKQQDQIHFQLPLDPDAALPMTTVNYTVVADVTGYTDSNWRVFGEVRIHNPAPIPAVIHSVSDVISGFGAVAVNFGVTFPYTLVPGGTLTGSYSSPLPDAASRTNTATALLVNHYYTLAGAVNVIGTTPFSGQAAIQFGTPSEEVDRCAAISDNLAGTLGTVCIGDLPKTFRYTHQFGPWDPEDCGASFERNNIATLVTGDTGTNLTSQWTVTIRINCDEERLPLGLKASCIDPLAYRPVIRVHFEVTNPNSFVVEIPHGLNNALEPVAYQGTQPTLFAPGVTEWEVEIDRHEILQWLLDGSVATASNRLNICSYATQDDVYIAGIGLFYDTNRNGQFDAGEALLAPDFEGKIGEVYLVDADGKSVDSRTLGSELIFRAGRNVNFSFRQLWGEYYLVPQLSVPLPAGYRIYPNYRVVHTDEFPAPFYSLNNDFGLVPDGFTADPATNLDLPRIAALDWYLDHPVKPGVAKAAAEATALAAVPVSFTLQQNYPNPFNPQTTISYDLAESASVTLTIYTVTGTVFERLVEEEQAAGSYSRVWNAAQNPSGIYFYELRAGGFRQVKRMLLMK